MNTFYKFSLLAIFFTFSVNSFSQVGIGTVNPDVSSMLDITSTTGGLLIPKVTQAQRTAIATPATGLLVYQTDATAGFWYYNGTIWATFGTSGWSLTGDAATNPATNYLGTSDAQDLIIATNNTEKIRVNTSGNVGINQASPSVKLHITGASPVFRMQDGKEGLNKVLLSDANGATSWGSSSGYSSADDDWRFESGSTFADPIKHTGSVLIGRSGAVTPATLDLDVDNGAATGTTIGIGDVERIQDGNNETQFSHQLIPTVDNSYHSLGYTSRRWNTVYAVNGTIQTSDRNQKTDIQTLSYGLTDLMKLRPVSYYWKEERHSSVIIPQEEKQLKLGLIAQEVEKIIPEVVYTYGWKAKSEKEKDTFVRYDYDRIGINYEELIPLLIKAKQEQNEALEKLSAETKDLSNRLQKLLNAK
jgi:hypothetical protein